jgi:hypothetical protein
MRPREEDGASLRDAFESLAEEALPLEEADLDRVWRAVAGELSAPERREVVEKVAADPSWALAWRVANELWLASPEHNAPRLRTRWTGYAAMAAVMLLAAGVGLLWRPASTPGYREPAGARIESLVPEAHAMPGSGFVLRWSGPPDAAAYDLTVSSEDLRHVHTESDLRKSEYQVPERFLAEIPGNRVFWRVTARLPDGTIVSGSTFVARLQRGE